METPTLNSQREEESVFCAEVESNFWCCGLRGSGSRGMCLDGETKREAKIYESVTHTQAPPKNKLLREGGRWM